jgi:hypothetical protein
MVITTDTCGIAERRVLLKSVQRVHGSTKGHINRTYSITKDFGAGLPPNEWTTINWCHSQRCHSHRYIYLICMEIHYYY